MRALIGEKQVLKFLSFIVVFAALLVLGSISIQAEAKEELYKIYHLPNKPTKQRILEFISSGVRWGFDNQYTFGRDGKASWGSLSSHAVCEKYVRFIIKKDSIEFECQVLPGLEVYKKTFESFKLHIDLFSPEVLVFRHAVLGEGEKRRIVLDCEKAPPSDNSQEQNYSRICDDNANTLVEIVPGATDKTLFDKVKSRIQRITFDDSRVFRDYFPVFFEGPPANKIRVESEIFFTNDQEKVAKEFARILEPLIAPVVVKKWPGDWDYDVVLVMGSKPASPKTESPTAP